MTLLKKRLSKDMSPAGAKKVRVSYDSSSDALPLYSADAARLEMMERLRLRELMEARAASEFKLARRGSATAAMMMMGARSTSPPRLQATAPFASGIQGGMGSSIVTPTNLSPDQSPFAHAEAKAIPSPRTLPSLPFERRQQRRSSPAPAPRRAHESSNPASSMNPLDLLCSVSTHVAARSEAASRSASPEEVPHPLSRAKNRQVSVSPDAVEQAYRYQPAGSPRAFKETYQVGSSPREYQVGSSPAYQEYQAATPYVVKSSYQAGSPRSSSPAEPSYAGERHPSTGLRHGRGIMAYPNGCRYDGEFSHDKRSGFGKCWYPDNLGVYTGMWENNKKEGKGTMVYANGDVYEGEWSNDRPNGVGTLRMKESRESFTGEFVNRKKHGRGMYEHANGDVYEGTWENDVRHGEGVVMYANGEVFGRVYCRGRLL